MLELPLLLNQQFKIRVLLFVKLNLLPKSIRLYSKIVYLQLHELLVLLQLSAHSLVTFLVVLLRNCQLSMVADFNLESISFFLDLSHGFVGKF